MKTKLVPFDVEKAKQGARIVTDDERRRPVKILEYNRKVKNDYTQAGDESIVALVDMGDYEDACYFNNNGEGLWYNLCIEEKEVEEKVEETDDYNPYKIAIEVLANMVKLYASADSDELKDFYNEVKAKCKEAVEYDNIWNKKQDEKPANNKPKFQKGDWITQEIAGAGVFKITEICKSWYEVIDSKGGCHYSISFDNEYMCHIWTIQDAKDGDVLVCIGKYGQEIGIVKKYVGKYGGCDKCFETYCFVDWDGIFRLSEYYMGSKEFYPATKEQCDFLFQKMKEAGYEWNSDKKELHKIEEIKKRRMTNQELSWWLRDCPEEHREWSQGGGEYSQGGEYSRYVQSGSYDYFADDANVKVADNILIRRNGGEWEEPLIEE